VTDCSPSSRAVDLAWGNSGSNYLDPFGERITIYDPPGASMWPSWIMTVSWS
jgi:hypothetical protein